MRNIAIGLADLSGAGTLKEISTGIWSHAHLKLDRRNIQFGDEMIAPDADLLGPGCECCFFITNKGSTESFYCGKIIRIHEAPSGEQIRFRIEFQLVSKTIKSSDIENYGGLRHGQHHVYY